MVNSRARFPPCKKLPDRRCRRPNGGRMHGIRTPEAIKETIRELIKQNSNTQSIIEHIKQHYGFVISRGPIDRERVRLGMDGRLGRPKGTRSSQNRPKAQLLEKQGLQPGEIAKRLGISRQAVYKLLKDTDENGENK